MESELITAEELSCYFKSKKDLYKMLTIDCKSTEVNKFNRLLPPKILKLWFAIHQADISRREKGEVFIFILNLGSKER